MPQTIISRLLDAYRAFTTPAAGGEIPTSGAHVVDTPPVAHSFAPPSPVVDSYNDFVARFAAAGPQPLGPDYTALIDAANAYRNAIAMGDVNDTRYHLLRVARDLPPSDT